MSELVLSASSVPKMPIELPVCVKKSRRGKIKISATSKSRSVIKLTMFVLLALTVYGFLTFDYRNIDFARAISSTISNVQIMFGQPRLNFNTYLGALSQLLVTFSLGILSTIFGAIIAFFGALACARNISNPTVSSIVRAFVALIRAVPSLLWVLIFTVSAGIGSVAAVAGLTLHSAGYLIKAYSEAIEEMDSGTIEALRASGAGFWQIVFQAIVPASISYMTAWTFLRFEINFANAIIVGAVAGAGGIGYDLFMAGSFYFDMRELGFITYMVVITVIILELFANKIKAKVR